MLPSDRIWLDHGKKVRKLFLKSLFLTEEELLLQDSIWDEWRGVIGENRYYRLQELLTSSVNDSFKARAFSILLSPSLRVPPFSWEDTLTQNYFYTNLSLSSLKEPLRLYIFNLIVLNYDIVKKENWHPNEAFAFYNKLILQALALLHEDDPLGDKLFACYYLDDLRGEEEIISGFSHQSLRDLLSAPINEKWKWKGERHARNIILHGCPKEQGVRLSNYRIGLNGDAKKSLPYSRDLFASRIMFSLDHSKEKGVPLLLDDCLYNILKNLSEDKFADLRRLIASHIAEETQNFHIWNVQTLEAVNRLFAEFGENPILNDRLRRLITEGEKNLRINPAKKPQYEAVLAKMR